MSSTPPSASTSASPPPGGTAAALDGERLVRVEKLALLYQQAAHGPVTALLVVGLWVALLWPHAPLERMEIWIALLLTASALRFTLYGFYRHMRPQGEALLKWELPFVSSVWLFGIVCGLGGVWVTPADSTQYLAVSYLFLVGIAGASVSAYGAFIYITVGVMLCMLGPMLLWLALRGGNENLLLSLAGALFLATAIRGLFVYHRALTRSMHLSNELKESHRIAEWHARMDALTGLDNRRAFSEKADALLLLARRDSEPVSILLMDVDGFKQINDGLGHAAGDAALRHIAALLKRTLRASDVSARLGGDEFAVLLPATGPAAAREVAEKLRDLLAREPLAIHGSAVPFSLSIGIASGTGTTESLLIQSDLAMYSAKRAGKNQVVAAAA